MKSPQQWLSLTPVDTLFFRGSEPMVAGESHEVRSVFPPMPSTLMGAITSAILSQRGIKPRDFISSHGVPPDLARNYPLLGEPGRPNFQILGPLFSISTHDGKNEWLLPCPSHWFAKIPTINSERLHSSSNPPPPDRIHVNVAVISSEIVDSLGLKGSVQKPPLIVNPPQSDLKSLAGCWVNLSAIHSITNGDSEIIYHHCMDSLVPDSPSIFHLKTLCDFESRVGIKMETGSRKAEKGHIYSSTHVRLPSRLRMIVGLSEKLVDSHLDSSGVLALGGEQRQVLYQTLKDLPAIPDSKSSVIMSLGPFPFNDLETNGWLDHPRASGPILSMGGWDMKDGFHKPCCAYLPAGTVIFDLKQADTPFGFLNLHC